jgi:putative peptidoglycan lipid II flippase
LVGVLALPVVVAVVAAGFLDQPAKFELTSDMLRLTFPYILLISMTAMAGGILNTWKRFAVPAFTPVILNLCMIASAVWLAPRLEVPVTALAWGVLLAGILQLLFQLPFLYRAGLLPRPRWGWQHEGVQKIIKLMIPALFGSSVAQINLLFDTFIASFLVSGSVAWLYYADRLLEFPLGVVGIALATVVLPNLSQAHYQAGDDSFNQTLHWALQLVLIIALPATIGLFLLAQPILATFFEYGAFDNNDSLMSAYSLMAYSLGLPAFILIKILANGFYARQDTRTPVRIGIQAMILNMALNVLFVLWMLKTEFVAPHVGLALATTASAYFNAFRLARGLRGAALLGPPESYSLPLLKILCACSVMALLIYFTLPQFDLWGDWRWYQRLIELGWLIGPAILCYAALLWIMGFRRHHFVA